MVNDDALRDHLRQLLNEGGAHLGFEAAIAGLPPEMRGVRPREGVHSAWELLEHMRIAQWDILEFSRDAAHVSPNFPSGYWPASPEPPGDASWNESVEMFRRDHLEVIKLVNDRSVDLFSRIPHGEGQTLLREILLVADHNAYHLGEMVMLRRALGAWNK